MCADNRFANVRIQKHFSLTCEQPLCFIHVTKKQEKKRALANQGYTLKKSLRLKVKLVLNTRKCLEKEK